MRRPASLVAAVIVLAASVLAACQPAAPALTDPKDIIVKGVESLQHAKSFHVAATVSGSISLGALTTGSLNLEGTKLDADVDVASRNLRATFGVPALLALSGEAIVVDGTSYLKTSLTGPKFTKGTSPVATPDPSASPRVHPSAATDALRTFLDKPGVAPTIEADAACGTARCYQVRVELTPAELSAMASPLPSMGPLGNLPVDVSDATVTLTFGVDKATNRLTSLVVAVASEKTGSLSATITFSDWDKAFTFTAPPADQIGDGSGGLPFPLPSGLLP